MTKQNPKTQSPLGPVHSDSISRANKVPDAAKTFPNTTPGYAGPPLLHDPKRAGEKKK